MLVKNNAPGLQGFHTAKGVVYLKPGHSRDLDLTEDGERLAKRLPFVALGEIEEAPKPLKANDPPAKQTEKELLLEELAALGIQADKRTSVAKLKEALEEAKAQQS